MDDFVFKKIEAVSGPNPPGRHGHRAVIINNLIVVLFGGKNEILHDLNVFDINSNQWFIPPVCGTIPEGRASFGCASSGNFIYIFGGMLEYSQLTNSLYKLDVTKWVWTKLNPVPTGNGCFPVPRIGMSFTTVDDQIFIFGGLTNISKKEDSPVYLNDMFTLDLNGLFWSIPTPIIGQPPSPRESHTTVLFRFHSKGEEQKILINYGGMNGRRLGDLAFFDINKLTWSKNSIEGRIPRPRSLHSACVVGTKMYVFGGWTVIDEHLGDFETPASWTCCRDFLAFNLATFSWEFFTNEDEAESYKYPPKRAGHSAVAFDSRIYIFSGRYYNIKEKPAAQIYHRDFWCLDVVKPNTFPVLQLIKAATKFLELKWNIVLCADIYVLQIKPKKSPLHTGICQASGEKLFFKLLKNQSGKLELQNVRSDLSNMAQEWLTVGFFRQDKATVNGFFSPADVMVTNEMNSDQVPYVDEMTKLELQPDTTYEFRICAMNSRGLGPWSTIFEFKTLKNVESNTSSIDISLVPGGIHIKWRILNFKKSTEPVTYSVQLLREHPNRGQPFYDEVFSGHETECSLSSTWLKSAHYEVFENKHAVFFRIQSYNQHCVLNSSEFKWFPKVNV
ncbi:HCFC2.2 family protein [Megaselia abdita]